MGIKDYMKNKDIHSENIFLDIIYETVSDFRYSYFFLIYMVLLHNLTSVQFWIEYSSNCFVKYCFTFALRYI